MPQVVLTKVTKISKLTWDALAAVSTPGQRFLSYVLILLTTLGIIGLTIYKEPNSSNTVASQPIANNPITPVEPKPSDANIAITGRTSLNIGSTGEVEVWFTPADSDQLRAAQIAIKFDPGVIRVNDIQPGTGFGINVGERINNQIGEASIALAVTSEQFASQRTLLAKVSITRIAPGQTSLILAEFQSGESFYTAFVDQNFTLKAAPLTGISLN